MINCTEETFTTSLLLMLDVYFTTNEHTMKTTNSKEATCACCYQDLWQEFHHRSSNNKDRDSIYDYDSDHCNNDVSGIFFELANAPLVSYRLLLPSMVNNGFVKDNEHSIANQQSYNTTTRQRPATSASTIITIEQDVQGASQKHTGGIVWETAYLLLEYLTSQLQKNSNEITGGDTNNVQNIFSFLQDDTHSVNNNKCNDDQKTRRPRTIVEVGAGCGMLGLCLHRALQMTQEQQQESRGNDETGRLPLCRVVLTETNEVMDNLRKNFNRNYYSGCNSTDNDKTSSNTPSTIPSTISVCELDWNNYREHCQTAGIPAHSVDLILGTDVVFSTRFVEPLLQTMEYLLCPTTGVAVLCLQERCPDSHALLLEKASTYGFEIDDFSEGVFDEYPSCQFGRDLDCKLLKFRRKPSSLKKKKRKESKEKKIKSKQSIFKEKKARIETQRHML